MTRNCGESVFDKVAKGCKKLGMEIQFLVMGGGSWGTALAHVLADSGMTTRIWARDVQVVDEIQKKHLNSKYLPGLALSPAIQATHQLPEAILKSDVIVCAIPTQQIRSALGPVASILNGKSVLNSSKGIEQNSLKRVSEIVKDICPDSPYMIISGPSFAQEVIQRLPTAVTIGTTNESLAEQMQLAFSAPYFRAYRSKDVVGIELAGALKNVLAIATGVAAGLGLGHNAQAALINRGIAEVTRLGVKLGADAMTFMGLAGVGDLVLTCTGPLSRNRRLGIEIGKGKSFEEVKALIGGVAEGYYTAQSAYLLAKKAQVEMPITENVYRILYEGLPPKQALTELMSRDLKSEHNAT